MKTTFSKTWKSSSKPRKQRKYRFNAPIQIKRKLLASPLSKELKELHKKNAVPIRIGDKVKIINGNFKGKEGEVEKIYIKKMKIGISKIEVEKKDGSKSKIPVDPSNCVIVSLKKDKKRLENKKWLKDILKDWYFQIHGMY